MTVRFSIIIPTYNRAHQLPRAIRSLQRQSFQDFEILVIDDGSTDDTAACLRSLRAKEPRLRWWHQENAGVCAARNRGIQEAQGEIITFLDSDDEVLPEWLETFSKLLSSAERVGVACCAIDMQVLDSPEENKVWQPFKPSVAPELGAGLFMAGSFAVRQEILDSTGGYAESMTFSENTELGLRLVLNCKEEGWRLASTNQALVLYWQQRESPSANSLKQRLESGEFLLERHGDHFPERSRSLLEGTAGVRAARLQNYARARHWFLLAAQHRPWSLRTWLRLLVAYFPFLSRRLWKPV